jgi:hypothetical protein
MCFENSIFLLQEINLEYVFGNTFSNLAIYLCEFFIRFFLSKILLAKGFTNLELGTQKFIIVFLSIPHKF